MIYLLNCVTHQVNGTHTYSRQLKTILLNNGFDVKYVCLKSGKNFDKLCDYEINFKQLIQLQSNDVLYITGFNSEYYFNRFVRYGIRFIDVIQTLKDKGVKIYFTVHSLLENNLFDKDKFSILNEMAPLVNGVIVNGEFSKKVLEEQFNIPVYNLNLPFTRRNTFIDKNSKKFSFYCGQRLTNIKNIEDIIKKFKDFNGDLLVFGAEYGRRWNESKQIFDEFAGGLAQKGYMDKLFKLIDSLGIKDKVIFTNGNKQLNDKYISKCNFSIDISFHGDYNRPQYIQLEAIDNGLLAICDHRFKEGNNQLISDLEFFSQNKGVWFNPHNNKTFLFYDKNNDQSKSLFQIGKLNQDKWIDSYITETNDKILHFFNNL